jgi:phosphatidate cytidylyltransferase
MAWEWARICGRRVNPADPTPGARLPSSGRSAEVIVSVAVVVTGIAVESFPDPAPPNLLGWPLILGGAVLAVAVALPRHGLRAIWFGLGVVYVATPCFAILWVRADPDAGLATMIWMLVLVIAADTGAYAAGRSIGGPKLAPRISPSKTWAGLGGAVICAGIVGLGTAFWLEKMDVWPLALASAALAVVEQVGDLAESAFKRRFGVKDSSHIIPGHGGVLDRVDGLLAVTVVVAGMDYVMGSSVLRWL